MDIPLQFWSRRLARELAGAQASALATSVTRVQPLNGRLVARSECTRQPRRTHSGRKLDKRSRTSVTLLFEFVSHGVGLTLRFSGGARAVRGNRLLGAHHTAVVAAGTSIVDVQIAHAFIGKETPDAVFEFAAIHDLRANHHCRRVVSANG